MEKKKEPIDMLQSILENLRKVERKFEWEFQAGNKKPISTDDFIAWIVEELGTVRKAIREHEGKEAELQFIVSAALNCLCIAFQRSYSTLDLEASIFSELDKYTERYLK